ncbi:MAG: CGNR zinc finger domain-containing protein [Acidobacteria bacterium]|nr:CGNR zinc finger domain-containing protein [Acidobacteriota bacterium]
MAEKTSDQFYFIGNNLGIDFVNTLVSDGEKPVDLLASFADFVHWLSALQVIEAAQAKEFLKRWSDSPESATAFQQVVEFREVLKQLFERIVHGRTIQQKSIDAINALLRLQLGYAELRRVKGGFEKRFHSSLDEPLHLILPIAEAACDLIGYGDLSLIKQCENPPCVLFFYDTSKNHARRWCSMNLCGNRAKAAAHYQKRKLAAKAK